MKSFVITINDIPQSVEYAKRCITSGAKHGSLIEHFDAITPRNTDIYKMLGKENIPALGFEEQYSRMDNCIAAFLSHYSLWKLCSVQSYAFTIYEHDAVIIDQINSTIPVDKCVTLGKPSYGKYNTPNFLGTGPLIQKKYFGGAHAYKISPKGAMALVQRAQVDACPTDVYLHIDRFPWLQEHYPWRAEVKDSFTTIQNTKGCLAKHCYGENYEIL